MVRRQNKKQSNSDSDSDSDEDQSFYYSYASTSAEQHTSSLSKRSSSGGLAPSKSTHYISNLDYSLTNSDLHTLFSTFSKIPCGTVLKVRLSHGVAYVRYVSRPDVFSATSQMDSKILNGRAITASIAADNGQAPEFIKKRVDKDKSRCYECGEHGHLSYECPKNKQGPREWPVLKRRGGVPVRREEGESDGGEGFEDDNWASVVYHVVEEMLLREGGDVAEDRKRKKKAIYFSHESDKDD